ncbi:Mitochodrial transcription termination factor-related [Macleaya cordata]|uniref:Mitochodrial transcription termination factor-related n=1 Tax=Macleaya cordata TaxID=56857 RepID=A0A200Q1X3_MACCD|nr:Mitochodrial transcription termination factor-related [Macleaya cordata]
MSLSTLIFSHRSSLPAKSRLKALLLCYIINGRPIGEEEEEEMEYKYKHLLLVSSHHHLPPQPLPQPVSRLHVKRIPHLCRPTPNQFTHDYQVNSRAALPPHAASLTPSNRFLSSSSEFSDSVRVTLKSYGFTETQIIDLISKRPALLGVDPVNILKPKLDFLFSFEVTSAEVTELITSHPEILTRSLVNHLIPSYQILIKYVKNDANVLKVISNSRAFETKIEAFLEELSLEGVPETYITKLLLITPRTFEVPLPIFREFVKKAKHFRFKPENPNFCLALKTLSCVTESVWNEKLLVFKECGLGEKHVINMFQKYPQVMMVSKEKIRAILNFFSNKLKCGPEMAYKHPFLLTFSLKKRLAPRHSVIKILISKGIIREDNTDWNNIFTLSKTEFSEVYKV